MLIDEINKIKEALEPFTLDLRYYFVRNDAVELLAKAVEEAQVPLTLKLNSDNMANGALQRLEKAIKKAGVPVNLHLSNSADIDEDGVRLLVENLNAEPVPVPVPLMDLGHNSIGVAGAELLAQAFEQTLEQTLEQALEQTLKEAQASLALNFGEAIGVSKAFLDDARKDVRSSSLKSFGCAWCDLHIGIIEQSLSMPSPLVMLVLDYFCDNMPARILMHLPKRGALKDASQEEGKVAFKASDSSSPSQLLKKKRDNGSKTAELLEEGQHCNASSIEDGGAPTSSSSSSSSSSSYSGGSSDEAQSDKLDGQQPTELSDLHSINYVQQQATHVNNDDRQSAGSEALLKKFFIWIKDIPEELQQQILSSFSIQKMLKFLETTLNPDKFIEDQCNFKATRDKPELEYQLDRFGNFSGVSQEYAQSNIDLPISVGEYEQFGSGILLDPLEPSFHLANALDDLMLIASM